MPTMAHISAHRAENGSTRPLLSRIPLSPCRRMTNTAPPQAAATPDPTVILACVCALHRPIRQAASGYFFGRGQATPRQYPTQPTTHCATSVRRPGWLVTTRRNPDQVSPLETEGEKACRAAIRREQRQPRSTASAGGSANLPNTLFTYETRCRLRVLARRQSPHHRT